MLPPGKVWLLYIGSGVFKQSRWIEGIDNQKCKVIDIQDAHNNVGKMLILVQISFPECHQHGYESWMRVKLVEDFVVPTPHLFGRKWWHCWGSRSYQTGLWHVPYSSPHMLDFWVGTVYCWKCRTELHHSDFWQWHGRQWLLTQLSRRPQQIR